LQNRVIVSARTGPIDADERSGALDPAGLARFRARWLAPDPAVAAVVDTYWAVEWALPPGERVEQRIIDAPAVTLSLESGDVPAPVVLTAVRRRAWSRVLHGAGAVFAIRLRPAGLGVLSALDPTALAEETALTASVDARAAAAAATIAAADGPDARARAADTCIAALLEERPPTPAQLLANAAVDVLTADPRVGAVADVASRLGVGERTLQRALRTSVGMGPAAVARRVRLQEVVRRLSQPGADGARIAAELGYTDQAHLITDFRGVAGVTPGRYVRDLARSARALEDAPDASAPTR
jgi:AraC-like DNA-binding protein